MASVELTEEDINTIRIALLERKDRAVAGMDRLSSVHHFKYWKEEYAKADKLYWRLVRDYPRQYYGLD